MKLIKKAKLILLAPAIALGFFILAPMADAATSPSLGVATSYSILSGTYTNTAPGTVLNGDLGYTTGPATAATVNGNTHVADAAYNQAGIDQGTTLSALNSQPCTFTFDPGAIDLATDTTHGTVGVYEPGVYCITGAVSLGGGGTITLSGSGTYIFRMDGALTTSANSIVTLAGGASACNLWWTPTQATTLGANSTFAGTDIDASGITIGSTTTWTGRALAFGGTVSTNVDTINVPPACSTNPTNTGGTTGGSSGNGSSSSSSSTPGLPNTGYKAQRSDMSWWSFVAIVILASSVFYIARKQSSKIA